MRNYTMFSYDYLFGDHFALVSDQAKMLYIKMSFCANSGFVSNPKSVLDSLGYDRGCLQELINIEEILTIPNRSEVFITAYFVHNKNFNPMMWIYSPYAPYWRGRLWIKENRIATLNHPKQNEKVLNSEEDKLPNPNDKDEEFQNLLNEFKRLREPKKERTTN